MARLQDDPKVQELIAKAEERGAKNERKRISSLVSDAKSAAREIEDKGTKKAVADTLTSLASDIRGA